MNDKKPKQIGAILQEYEDIVNNITQLGYTIGRRVENGQDTTELLKELGEATKERDEYVRKVVWM